MASNRLFRNRVFIVHDSGKKRTQPGRCRGRLVRCARSVGSNGKTPIQCIVQSRTRTQAKSAVRQLETSLSLYDPGFPVRFAIFVRVGDVQLHENSRRRATLQQDSVIEGLLEAESWTGEAACIDLSIFDGKHTRQFSSPFLIGSRTILAGVSFHRGNSGYVCRQTAGMQE